MNTTWKKLISAALKAAEESWSDVISNTLSDADLNVEFDDGFGGSEGPPFTMWTHKRVYFPVVYDGAEWVESVSRDPDGKVTAHKGGQ